MNARYQDITAPVTQVRLREDRAWVRREASISVPAGLSHLRVLGLSPAVVDKTLDVLALGSGDVRVRDARVVRGVENVLDADRPARREALERAVARERGESEALKATQVALESAAHEVLAEIAAQAAAGLGDPTQWARCLDELDAAEVDMPGSAGDAERIRDAHKRTREALEREEHSARAECAPECAAALLLDVWAAEAGEVELEIDYLVPGAAWRPSYLLDLSSEPPTLRVEATIWQHSGEDWKGVEIEVSTERAADQLDPPAVGRDVLKTRPAGLSGPVSVPPPPSPLPIDVAPGIDAGGPVQRWRATAPADLPSNGRPHRVALADSAGPVGVEWRLSTQPTPGVFAEIAIQNALDRPLLAGPASVLRDGGPIGGAVLPRLAPGAQQILSFGPDPDLVVRASPSGTELLNLGARARRVVVRPGLPPIVLEPGVLDSVPTA